MLFGAGRYAGSLRATELVCVATVGVSDESRFGAIWSAGVGRAVVTRVLGFGAAIFDGAEGPDGLRDGCWTTCVLLGRIAGGGVENDFRAVRSAGVGRGVVVRELETLGFGAATFGVAGGPDGLLDDRCTTWILLDGGQGGGSFRTMELGFTAVVEGGVESIFFAESVGSVGRGVVARLIEALGLGATVFDVKEDPDKPLDDCWTTCVVLGGVEGAGLLCTAELRRVEAVGGGVDSDFRAGWAAAVGRGIGGREGEAVDFGVAPGPECGA